MSMFRQLLGSLAEDEIDHVRSCVIGLRKKSIARNQACGTRRQFPKSKC
jgi:hypothetical protein